VDFSFNPAKNARNVALHGVSLARAVDFEWEGALIVEDARRDYGERRYLAFGRIESRLYVLVHTPREGRVHVISLRKANKREVRRYANQAKGQESTNGS
jgi:uncharacterized DUF497 family protein